MKSDKEILSILSYKGYEALRTSDTESAEAIFKDVIEIDETYIDGWVGLAQVFYEKGDIDKSNKSLDKGLELLVSVRFKSWPPSRKLDWEKSTDKPVLRLVHQYGLNYFRQGKNKKAKEYFELETKLDPSRDAPQSMLNDIASNKSYQSLK